MTTSAKPKAFFTLNLPRRPKDGDVISVQAKLRKDPKEFRLILGVKAAEDRNTILEPSMIALEFKTLFANNDITVTTNWRIDSGWQQEEELDTDWIDAKGNVNIILSFENSSVLIKDSGNSLITKFPLKFELERINRIQLWGNIKEMQEISLKYNQSRLKRSPRKKSSSP